MEVSGISAAKAKQIEDASVNSGAINSSGFLELIRKDGTKINAGKVVQDVLVRKVESFTVANAAQGATWTKPTGAKRVRIILIGAGSGGGGYDSAVGGTGGALIDLTLSASLLNATETVTVGTGGQGTSVAGNGGGPGGHTTFTIKGKLLKAGGGSSGGSSVPGIPEFNGENMTAGGPFGYGGGYYAAQLEVFQDTGGGGLGQVDPDPGITRGGSGYYGFTRGGVRGPGAGAKGADGDPFEGIPGGGGAMSTDAIPGHGGFPGGGGARASTTARGGDGGHGSAVIITYFDLDQDV